MSGGEWVGLWLSWIWGVAMEWARVKWAVGINEVSRSFSPGLGKGELGGLSSDTVLTKGRFQGSDGKSGLPCILANSCAPNSCFSLWGKDQHCQPLQQVQCYRPCFGRNVQILRTCSLESLTELANSGKERSQVATGWWGVTR